MEQEIEELAKELREQCKEVELSARRLMNHSV